MFDSPNVTSHFKLIEDDLIEYGDDRTDLHRTAQIQPGRTTTANRQRPLAVLRQKRRFTARLPRQPGKATAHPASFRHRQQSR